MNFISKKNALRRSLLALLSGSALMLGACTLNDVAGLKVAGGTIDGAGDSAKYPGTVYVELLGEDFGGSQRIIRNVGTIVDVGLPDAYALILSLADVFQADANGLAQLPIMKKVELKLFLSNGENSITLPGMAMNRSGLMEDASKRNYFMLTVGVKAEKVGSLDPPVQQEAEGIARKVFLESPLVLSSGQNLRDSNTSYIMMAIPKNAHPAIASIRAPRILAAEERPSASQLKGVVVGFGENTVGGSQKSDFALAAALPSVMKRNYADIESLNKSVDEYTPFRQLIAGNQSVAQQLWEITGSGLCGSKDGSNYDTGASVYVDGKFAGFGVRSTSKKAGYKGRLICSATSRDDMVTLIVSPSKSEIEAFVQRYK